MPAADDRPASGAVSLGALREAALAREPDRYFAATLAPSALRYDLIVLAAFAAEIARIPSMVREPLAGEIRLQWWRDALGPDGAAVAAGHPVAAAMRVTIDRRALPAALVGAVIDAETDSVHGERPADEAALRARLAAGQGALFRLAAHVCAGGTNDIEEDAPTAASAAVAYGLSRTLARFPADGAARLAIPLSLVADDAVAAEEPAMAFDSAPLMSAVRALATMAREAHAGAAANLRLRSRRHRLAYLPLAMVRPNLAALERTLKRRGTQPYEPQSFARLVRVGWAHASGRL